MGKDDDGKHRQEDNTRDGRPDPPRPVPPPPDPNKHDRMTGPRIDPGELRARMVQRLAANTYLAQWEAPLAPWRPALATVPRHRYIPNTVWLDNDGKGPTLLPLHRDDDPDRWLELAYADDAVITQIDDGRPAGPGLGGAIPTSSASSPIMVADAGRAGRGFGASDPGDRHRYRL